MSEHRIQGDVENGLGKLEQGAGRVLGDAGLQVRGVADQARGAVDKTIGKVEDVVERAFGEPAARKVRKTAESAAGKAEEVYDQARTRLETRLNDEPYKVLAVVAGVGVLIGMLLGRRNHTIIYQPRD